MILPSKKILLVTEAPGLRMTIRNLLKREHGLRNFAAAPDGRKAYEMIVASWKTADRVELVISDWDLPMMSGIDLLIQVRSNAELKDLPFILMVTGDEPFHEAVQAGVSASIEKPIDGARLIEKIREAWTKHHGGLDRSSVRKLN